MRDQLETGIQASIGADGWPVWIALDYLSASDSESDLTSLGLIAPLFGQPISKTAAESKTREFDLGVRKFWGQNRVRPYLGGGVAFVEGEIIVEGFGLDDSAIGMWANAGLMFVIGEHVNLGIDLRVSRAEIAFSGEEFEAGGKHAGLTVGWNW